jgi:hypothetical protein
MMMKKTKKTANIVTTLFIILLIVGNFNLYAQKTSLEFSIQAGGAFEAFAFRPTVKNNSSSGYGSEVGVGFTGYFSPQWGIHFGANFNLYSVKSKLDTLKFVTSDLTVVVPDPLGEKALLYDLHTSLTGYTEIQKSMGITIPVMLQFQTRQNRQWQNWKQSSKVGFYAMGGVKVHFLIDNKYETSVSQLYNAAYFKEMGVWINTQTFAGLGSFNKGYESSGKINFNIMASLALEAGAKWYIDNKIFLYTGAYFDCGLNDPFKDSRSPRSNYIWEEQLKNLSLLKATKGLNLLAVGIKIRVGFWKAL